jgi:peptidoglycan hydrolase-like protein with peptidoglycan-binding domain
MSFKPGHARFALAGVVAVSTAIAANVLFLQDTPSNELRTRTKSMLQHDEDERSRRLSLATEGRSSASPTGQPASTQPVAARDAPAFDPTAPHIQRALLIDGAAAALPSPARADRAPVGSELIRHLYRELDQRGYAPGTAENGSGLALRGAILAYEHDEGLPLTAEATVELLLHLRNGPQAFRASPTRTPRGNEAQTIIRGVQQALQAKGHFKGVADGRMTPETALAIRAYESANRLVPTGRISAPFLVKLGPVLSLSTTSVATGR